MAGVNVHPDEFLELQLGEVGERIELLGNAISECGDTELKGRMEQERIVLLDEWSVLIGQSSEAVRLREPFIAQTMRMELVE